MRVSHLVVAVLMVACLGCGRTEAAASVGTWSRPSGALGRALEAPARLTVVYWPATGECMPPEAAAITVLQELAVEYPDLRFLTAIGRGIGTKDPRYGLDYPGEVVELEPFELDQAGFGPRPRVAAWGSDGALLFVRSLPPVVSEAVRLRDEIIWTRALTDELEVEEP
jgi:hypothetical protein